MAEQDVTVGVDRHGVEVENSPRPPGHARWRHQLASQAWLGGVDCRGGQTAARVLEEYDEHRGLGQPADPRLTAADQPCPVRAGRGTGTRGGWTGTAMRLGGSDAYELTGRHAGSPPVAKRGSSVPGDQTAVAEGHRIS